MTTSRVSPAASTLLFADRLPAVDSDDEEQREDDKWNDRGLNEITYD